MTDSQPKNGPRFVLAAAARICCFEGGKWPDNLTLEQVARLLAGGGLYKRSGEQKEYYRILKGMLYSDSNCGKLEFSEVPQGSVAVSTGISLENSPRFRTDYAAEKTPITPIRYISRKQLEDWLCNTGQKPGEYITEWLQVGGVVYGETKSPKCSDTETENDKKRSFHEPDRLDCQNICASLWERKPEMTVTGKNGVAKQPEVAAYLKKFSQKWVENQARVVMPKDRKGMPGRPKKLPPQTEK